MVKLFLRCVVAMATLSSITYAAVLQNQGEVYSIAEDDFRHFIYKRLTYLKNSGVFEQFEKEALSRMTQSVNRPKPLSLNTSLKSYAYHVSPEIVVKDDIRMPSGQMIAARGTTINPMNKVHYNGALIFFNADDLAQLSWVKSHLKDYNNPKLILTGGDIKKASQLLGRIYFDQEGIISQKLNIKHVPSIATQINNQWNIAVIGEKELAHD